MSSRLPPISEFTSIHRKRNSTPDINLPPLSSWSGSHDDYNDCSSSPPRSSSPRTPLASRYAHSYTHIISIPRMDSDIHLRGSSEFSDDLAPWDRPYHHIVHTTGPIGHKTISEREDYFPPSSEYDASETYEEVDFPPPDLGSENSSNSAAFHGSVFSLDSDEEHEDEGDGYSFGDGGLRATFFRTSAERGRWMSDPVPYKPSSIALLQIRKSAPTLSRVPTPTLHMVSRPTSEPLHPPCSQSQASGPQHSLGVDDFEASRSTSNVSFPDKGVREADSPHTLPSLTSDRESTSDPEEHEYCAPSSPLPSSSPPLSPMSFSVSAISRSVSPLHLVPSSPLLDTSSPLVETNPDIPYTDGLTLVDKAELGGGPSDGVIQSSDKRSMLRMLLSVDIPTEQTPFPVPIHSDLPTPIPALAEMEMPAKAVITSPILSAASSHEVLIDEERKSDSVCPSPPAPPTPHLVTTPSGAKSSLPPAPAPDVLDLFANDIDVVQGSSEEAISPTPSPLDPLTPLAEDEDTTSVIPTQDNSKVREVDNDEKALRVRDKNGALTQDDEKPQKVEVKATTAPVVSEKRKKELTHDQGGNGPVKKKRKTEVDEGASVSTTKHAPAPSESMKKQSKRRKVIEHEDHSDSTDLDPAPKAKKQKRVDDKGQPHKVTPPISEPSSNSLPTSQSKPKSNSMARAESRSAADDPETREIVGMLIETMATSRASSLALSSLYKSVMQSRPSLKTQRTEKEWMGVFRRVLNIFSGGGMGGVFGKVESSGKDESGHSLEAQWFYVPEMDEDQERATLIRSMMPRPAKRSETKKYKQYYWRPLDKISRWDPEDDL